MVWLGYGSAGAGAVLSGGRANVVVDNSAAIRVQLAALESHGDNTMCSAGSGGRGAGLNGTASFDVAARVGGVDIVLASIQISPVPEPAAGWLFALGPAASGLVRRARRGG